MFQTRFQSIPCVFILLQHSPAQRHSNNSFPINQLRTLFVATEGVPPPVPSLSFPPPSRPSPVTSHQSPVTSHQSRVTSHGTCLPLSTTVQSATLSLMYIVPGLSS